MIVGFTGTRYGMTPKQNLAVLSIVRSMKPTKFHHGDCKGADAQAHDIAGSVKAWRVAHPPSNDRLRAFCSAEEVREPKPYLDRNQDIVDETEVLIAAPRNSNSPVGSGTWSTIWRARKADKPIAIVHQDGRVDYERWEN